MVMRISVTQEGPISIINMAGEEDTRSEEAFSAAFRECFDKGCFNIILDLSRLKYLGSHLRKVLLANTKEALDAGGKIKLLQPQPAVRTYLKDNRLLDFFEVYNIRQVAIESFESDSIKRDKDGKEQLKVAKVPTKLPPEGGDVRLDRLENSLIQLIEILRKRGVITDEEENQIFD